MDPSGKADNKLDFYFSGTENMMRKLETSKPVRRTKTEKNQGAGAAGASASLSPVLGASGVGSSATGTTAANSNGGGGVLHALSSPQLGGTGGGGSNAHGTPGGGNGAGNAGSSPAGAGGAAQPYLFKWQRDEGNSDDEEEEASPAKSKSGGRWNVITGNVPVSALSIAAFFDTNGMQGKPLKDGLVNAAGVILLAPGTSMIEGEDGGLQERIALHETKGGRDNHNDLLLDDDNLANPARGTVVATKRGNQKGGTMREEVLMFRRSHNHWPPEPPAFPPPPPDPSETVTGKKVPKTGPPASVVRRLSRAQPKLTLVGASFRGGEGETANGGGGSMMVVPRTRAPSGAPKDVQPRSRDGAGGGGGGGGGGGSGGGGILRRISFMPTMMSGSSKNQNAYPGRYASQIQVVYMLPPPPEPPRPPLPGSNDERKQQRINMKKLFLEDCYSAIIELAEEKIRLSEMCRDLESQITSADQQINALIEKE